VNGSGYVDGFNPATPATPTGVPMSADDPTVPAPPSAQDSASVDVDAGSGTTGCYYLTSGGSSCAPGAPAGACEHYLHPNHLSVGLALRWNRPIASVDQFDSLCRGDPTTAATFGTQNRSDGDAFWSAIFENDGSGTGSAGAYRAYAWDTGLNAFDPYGAVSDTCPGSAAVASLGQWQYACQESVSELSGRGPPSLPGDRVLGMRNAYTGAGGEGFTYPL